MQRSIRLLAALLAVQLLLALGLGLSDRGLSAKIESAPLVEVAKERLDRITLEGPDEAKVVLAKRDGEWRLPQIDEFPADAERIERFIDRLNGLQGGAPVATTEGAQARFKVNDAAFERRITLATGDDALATLYLGTSPGVRRTHARADGQGAIYAVELAAYDVPVEVADWEDKALLTLPKAEIAAIETDGLRIERATASDAEPSSPAWTANGLEQGQNLNPDAADRLAGLLAELRFDAVLGRDLSPDYGLEQPLVALTLTREGGETIDYRIGKAADEEAYSLKVSTRPEYFRLAGYTATPIIDAATRETLLGEAASPADAAAESAPVPAQ